MLSVIFLSIYALKRRREGKAGEPEKEGKKEGRGKEGRWVDGGIEGWWEGGKKNFKKISPHFSHHENNYCTMLTIPIMSNSVSILETKRKIILLFVIV